MLTNFSAQAQMAFEEGERDVYIESKHVIVNVQYI